MERAAGLAVVGPKLGERTGMLTARANATLRTSLTELFGEPQELGQLAASNAAAHDQQSTRTTSSRPQRQQATSCSLLRSRSARSRTRSPKPSTTSWDRRPLASLLTRPS